LSYVRFLARRRGVFQQLRAKAAISLGPVLEQAETDGFEDPDDVPITERTFRNIQDSLEKIYLDNSTPKEETAGRATTNSQRLEENNWKLSCRSSSA
jgi:hypothetical protein